MGGGDLGERSATAHGVGERRRDLGGTSVAAVGPATAEALAGYGIKADLVPDKAVGESLVEAFPARSGGGGRVLLARAEVARDIVPDGLRQKGWQVEIVEAYRTIPEVPIDEQREAVAAADAVTFTSSSTVERFVDAFGADSVPGLVVAIGPVTAATAAGSGIEVDAVADPHTLPGLVEALIAARR